MNRSRHPLARAADGYALLTAIVFLVLLTLVALAAIRGTGLEVQSGANGTRRAEAFEAAEIARSVVAPLIDLLCRNGGWPVSIGGTVPDAEFHAPLPAGVRIVDRSVAAGPDNWCLEADSEAGFETGPLDIDATYSRDLRDTLGVRIDGEVAIHRLHTSAVAGAGQAQAAGYAGNGVGIAGGGGQIYFHIRSHGREHASHAEARVSTAASYRYVIRR